MIRHIESQMEMANGPQAPPSSASNANSASSHRLDTKDAVLQNKKAMSTFATLPAEMLERIFAAAIPEQVLVKDGREITVTVGFRPYPGNYIQWVPEWAYRLTTLSKRLRAIAGPILYSRITIQPYVFLTRLIYARPVVAGLMQHEPTRCSRGFGYPACAAKHQLDRKLRKMCGLPSACILLAGEEDTLSPAAFTVHDLGESQFYGGV
jgi:hypothetical protein